MTLIDSHCHLNSDFTPKSDTDLVREAAQAGVETLITIGTDLASISHIQEISNRFPSVFHTIGVHPHDSIEITDPDLALLEKAALHPKCRAIGEIGLDYHYDHSPREVQVRRLEQQLELAVNLKQPVIIHSREGEEELLKALSRYAKKITPPLPPGIIHCFSGTTRFGEACLDLGFYISFSGILTFKKADDIRKSAKAFPLHRLLVETDAPFLAPVPFRGKKCEPSMIKITAEKLAEVKNISFEEVAVVTTQNAKKIFQL